MIINIKKLRKEQSIDIENKDWLWSIYINYL